MTGRVDIWIRRTTVGCVALLALIAGTVSYHHMQRLVALHEQPGWVPALTPLSVDGIILAEIARQHGRCERWGRLVKSAGMAGEFADIRAEESAADGMMQRAAP
jgi:Protein of unknown function (DUF2637)